MIRIFSLSLIFILLSIQTIKAQWSSLPENMFADSAHAPFLYGVASGDPLPDGIILWSHITASPDSSFETVYWELASDEAFAQTVQTGSLIVDSISNWTVKVDVSGLQSGTHYYYRFHDGEGNYSMNGRTKTASNGNPNDLKFAIASCSSIFSGFFNAYQRIGERDDLDALIHLGDYIYDFVDQDEEVRIPTPYPLDPSTLDEWRQRHRYYLLDPDLRYARSMHPMILMWDNHDIAQNDRSIPVQAFMEWTPSRQVDTVETKFYRSFNYGNLVDIFMLDIMIHRDVDDWQNGNYSLLGFEQYQWFTQALQQSQAKWKIVGSQKMFGYWGITSLGGFIPGSGDVFSSSTWDGYQFERRLLLDLIDSLNIQNIIFISGDSHISAGLDIPNFAGDSTVYDEETGMGSLAVEFLPTSITRGNFDEAGVNAILQNVLIELSKIENPHQYHMELSSHGYGTLQLFADSSVAEYWYSDILNISNQESAGERLVVLDGAGHWRRPEELVNTVSTLPSERSLKFYPNPVNEILNLELNERLNSLSWLIFDMQGNVISSSQISNDAVEFISIPTHDLQAGTYGLILEFEGGYESIVFTKQ